jgi:hypothetical protein
LLRQQLRSIGRLAAGVLVASGVALATAGCSDLSSPPGLAAGAAASTSAAPSGPGGIETTTTAPAPTTAPTTAATVVYPAIYAVNTEVAVTTKLHGCWSDAQPGNAADAYRQDYYYPSGGDCQGPGWLIDVELFNQPAPTQAAERDAPAGSTLYRDNNTLVVVPATAPRSVQHVVRDIPGLNPVTRRP